jgi:30S ribosome assembly GTPase
VGSEIIPRKDLAALLPDKPLKALTYQLNEKQTLFFGSLVRFDFLEGERQSFTVYSSSGIPVHRTKLERADELYADHRGVMLSPPSLEDLDSLPQWTRHRLRIPANTEQDIFISGLGWIKANGKSGATVDVHAPRGIKVMLRASIL